MFEHFVWAGLLDRDFLVARPHDQFGFAITYYKVSNRLTATEELQRDRGLPFSGGAFDVQSDAFVLEANYALPIYRGVEVQPEFEYFIRPGAQKAVPNALVLGLKTHVLF